MGGSASRHLLPACFRRAASDGSADASAPPIVKDPLEEALGHSFCYVRSAATPGHSRSSSLSSDVAAAVTTAASFKSISGAAVSANSTCPQPVFDNAADADDGDLAAGGGGEIAANHRPPGFRSSASFSALPLQLSSSASASGSLDRGFFLSGPIESGALSGPLDGPSTTAALPFSGPLAKRSRRRTASGGLRRASLFRRSLSERNRPWVVPLRSLRREASVAAPQPAGCLQWAQGKAGEDRVHIVVSKEHHWLFIGIYDGFNGPEAPEFLVSNLYRSVFDMLRGLFGEEAEEHASDDTPTPIIVEEEEHKPSRCLWEFLQEESELRGLEFAGSGRFAFSLSKLRNGLVSWRKDGSWNWFPWWRYDSEDKAKVALDRPKGRRRRKAGPVGDHQLVLRALSRALELTELAYLEMTDRAMNCNPEVAVMGSCLLVALTRDDNVYVMNVGDSRAIVAQYKPWEMVYRSTSGGVEMHLAEDTLQGVERVEVDLRDTKTIELGALQLSTDHSPSIEEEVLRIRKEHPDDNHCIVNDRVKGRLKVTRAFGAGYLKQIHGYAIRNDCHQNVSGEGAGKKKADSEVEKGKPMFKKNCEPLTDSSTDSGIQGTNEAVVDLTGEVGGLMNNWIRFSAEEKGKSKLVIEEDRWSLGRKEVELDDNRMLVEEVASIWEMDGLQMNMEFNQIFITLLDGSTRCLQFPSPTISGGVLKRHLSYLTGIPASVQRLVTGSLNVHDDTHLSASAGFFPSCTLLLRLRAGKGGVRGASQKKTHNFVACQDLSGRCIQHVNAEKMMNEWKAVAEDRKLKKLEEKSLIKRSKEVKKISQVVVGTEEGSVEDAGEEKLVVPDDESKEVGGTSWSASQPVGEVSHGCGGSEAGNLFGVAPTSSSLAFRGGGSLRATLPQAIREASSLPVTRSSRGCALVLPARFCNSSPIAPPKPVSLVFVGN